MVDIKGFMKEMDIDSEMARELYDIFAEELAEERDQLLRDWEEGDAENFYRTLHNIKGISSSYRAYDVWKTAEGLYVAGEGDEQVQKEQFRLLTPERLKALTDEMEGALGEIADYFAAP